MGQPIFCWYAHLDDDVQVGVDDDVQVGVDKGMGWRSRPGIFQRLGMNLEGYPLRNQFSGNPHVSRRSLNS